MMPTLIDIYLYPYLNLFFYSILLFLIVKFIRNDRALFYIFIISLIFERSFLLDVGFFIRLSHIMAVLLMLVVISRGYAFKPEPKYAVLLWAFFFVSIISVFVNFDLIGKAISSETRATFLRPVMQVVQLSVLILIVFFVVRFLHRYNNFGQTMRLIHWLGVAVSIYAIYEVMSIYFHLPFVNLNNDQPSYWYMGFPLRSGFSVFRPRSTFFEPLAFNNFLFFTMACSLIYRQLFDKRGIKYWSLFGIQLVALVISYSRSALAVLFVSGVILVLLYPLKNTINVYDLKRLFQVCVKIAVVIVFIIVSYNFILLDDYPDKAGTNRNIVYQILLDRFYHLKEIPDTGSITHREGSKLEIKEVYDSGRWFLGIGLGNEANWRGGVGGFNNFYCQVFFYTGLVGITIFLWFMGLILFSLIRNYLDFRNGNLNKKISLIYFVGLLSVIVQRLVVVGLLTDVHLWVSFAIGIYIAKTFRRQPVIATTPESYPTPV